MSPFVSGYCSRFVLRLAVVGASAGALAGCASSERLAEAFDNPFQQTASAPTTGPAPDSTPPVATAPVTAVQSRPLSPSVAQYTPPAPSAPRAVAAAVPGSANSYGGWTAEGGSPITVSHGDSAEVLARRYGVPVEALVRTNGFATASEVQPGTRLVVPVYSAALAAAKPAPRRGADQPRDLAAAIKPVPPTKTAASALSAPKPAAAPIAVPARPLAAPSPAPAKMAEAPVTLKPLPAARKPEPAKKVVAKLDPVQVQAVKGASPAKVETIKTAKAAPVVVEAKKSEPEPAPVAAQETAKTNIASEIANPEFRWPARGRIIQGFKRGGNDGINIAVPEGTSVKAAENGVVAYAGELKGYGNLVMIRHPNGFVSAYANNGDIEVKRGDNVKRGQTIARSGRSGDVSSPQLHFELRKGATPVDPTQYLAGL
jgi:murein DD-endopeptidase MepM/ murein hydrolase activator NlpD